MQFKSPIALGQFPVTQRVMKELWGTLSHFGCKLINQKSSHASQDLGRIVRRDRKEYYRLLQVLWGGDSVGMEQGPPLQDGQIPTDGRRRSNSIQKIGKQKIDSDRCGIVCPVCGKILSAGNLPDAESIFTDGVCYYETDKIISSSLFIEHEFTHFYNEEEDCVMEEPHALKALIHVEFDAQGVCTEFCMVKVWPII